MNGREFAEYGPAPGERVSLLGGATYEGDCRPSGDLELPIGDEGSGERLGFIETTSFNSAIRVDKLVKPFPLPSQSHSQTIRSPTYLTSRSPLAKYKHCETSSCIHWSLPTCETARPGSKARLSKVSMDAELTLRP